MDARFKDNYHAEIRPVDDETPRPVWSVLIPTHNCADYLREALTSVLCQDPGSDRMEIIVVDDCSTRDDPAAVVRELGGDRVQFFRQKENVGKVRNYETGLQRSRGHLIHQLHGDDRIRPGFYRTMGKLFENNPQAGAAFCRSIYIDANGKWTCITGAEQYEDGIVPDFLKRIVIKQRIQTPAVVVRREVYEALGGFDRRFNCIEDWEMWIRVASQFPVAFSNNVLAEYRTHGNNATWETMTDGRLLDAHRRLLAIVDAYLTPDLVRDIKGARGREQAEFFLHSATALRRGGERGKALRFLAHGLQLSKHPATLYRAVRSLLK